MIIQTNYNALMTKEIAQNPTYKAICDYNINIFPEDGYKKYYRSLENGRAILQNESQLITYLAAYGDMHQTKLSDAFKTLFSKENFNGQSIEVVDWGCGQALASGALIDFIKENDVHVDLSQFTLIDPSNVALKRGIQHVKAMYQRQPPAKILYLVGNADGRIKTSNCSSQEKIKLHLFSNILDIEDVKLSAIHANICNNFTGINYFLCVSPVNAFRLNEFSNLFSKKTLISQKNSRILTSVFRPSCMKRISKSISRIEYIFKAEL